MQQIIFKLFNSSMGKISAKVLKLQVVPDILKLENLVFFSDGGAIEHEQIKAQNRVQPKHQLHYMRNLEIVILLFTTVLIPYWDMSKCLLCFRLTGKKVPKMPEFKFTFFNLFILFISLGLSLVSSVFLNNETLLTCTVAWLSTRCLLISTSEYPLNAVCRMSLA